MPGLWRSSTMPRFTATAAGSAATGLRAELIARFGARVASGHGRRGDQRTLDRLTAGVPVQIVRQDIPPQWRPDEFHSLYELRGDRLVPVPAWKHGAEPPAQWTVPFEPQPQVSTDPRLANPEAVTRG
jgi:hypothetical protein